MTFELPDLDTKTYAQLVAGLLRHIPQYTDQWTDYNDTDPGITLLQLLAWIDESLLYQANRIPTLTDENFLRWVLGLACSTNETPYSKAAAKQYDDDFMALQAVLARIENGAPMSRPALQREVLLYLQQPYMALTLPNLEVLAKQANRVIAQQYAQQKARHDKSHSSEPLPTPLYVKAAYAQTSDQASVVYILNDAAWNYQYPPYPNTIEYIATQHTMRSLLLAQPQDLSDAEATLLFQVNAYLQPRVIGGSSVMVRAAQLTPIDLAMTVRCTPDTSLSVTLDALVTLLYDYLLPKGGPAARGWAYGEAPGAADLMHLVLGVPGVAALESFVYTHVPTIVPGEMAQLGADTLLAALPNGRTAMFYAGLPCLRCLDITAMDSPA